MSRFGRRRKPRAPEPAPPEPPPPTSFLPVEDTIFPTKALRKFIGYLAARPSPVLVDLGPSVPANIMLFAEQYGCKVIVVDAATDIERQARAGLLGKAGDLIVSRLPGQAESVDGVLCWDLFDYLEPASAQALAKALSRALRPNGVLLGFFRTTTSPVLHYSRFLVTEDLSLRQHPYGAPIARQHVLQNRDIIRMFDALRVVDSFLLLANVREILFRKPEYLSTQLR